MIVLFIIIAVWLISIPAQNYYDDVARQRYYDELRLEKAEEQPKRVKSPKIRWIP